MQTQTGQTYEDAYYFITQALNDLDNPDKGYYQYADIAVNIWLFKGVHHYIYCFNSEETVLNDYLKASDVAMMCADVRDGIP